jgi:CBS domain-containing protein
MFAAKDIMTTHVVAVGADDTLDSAISLMVRHRISGLPVLNKEGRPIGIISEFDLLKLICNGETEKARVSEYMSPGLFGVSEQDDWVRVADMFRAKHVRRLPVLRDGMLVGIVTRHDLVRAIRDARRQLRQQMAQHALHTAGGDSAGTVPAACAGPGRTGA